MNGRKLLLVLTLLAAGFYSQAQINQGRYLTILDDAHFDIGMKMTSIIALDDRARLSSNPHFQAMWNLVKLGASLEALMQGNDEPLNDINLGKKFGANGYNKTIPMVFFSYGFGESSDVKLQRHFLELGLSPGFFKEGRNGMNAHLDYRWHFLNTNYSAGGGSIERTFDYEIFMGMRMGFDWSFRRSESEAGFFNHLNNEVKRIAFENEFSASDLIRLQDLIDDSRILLPEDVGGRTFHIGPIAGASLSKKLMKNMRAFVTAQGFYDLMDLSSGRQDEENKRSQHHAAVMLGLSITIGAEGQVLDFF